MPKNCKQHFYPIGISFCIRRITQKMKMNLFRWKNFNDQFDDLKNMFFLNRKKKMTDQL